MKEDDDQELNKIFIHKMIKDLNIYSFKQLVFTHILPPLISFFIFSLRILTHSIPEPGKERGERNNEKESILGKSICCKS